MSTPISGSSNAGLSGALISPVASGSAGHTKSRQTGALPDAGNLAAEALAAAMQAANSVSQLASAFGQALQGTTTVDPSTGVSEVSASASSQLSSALDSFLVQSGFSQQQADAAATGFAAQLAAGGPIDLNASFDDTTTLATSMSATYGSQTMSASSVAVNERSGSVAIEFDPKSGKLSISLQEQQVASVTSVMEVSGPSPSAMLSLVPVNVLSLLPAEAQQNNLLNMLPAQAQNNLLNLLPGGAQNNDADSNDADGNDTATAPSAPDAASASAPASDANSVLSGLIAGLSRPTLHGTQDALDLLNRTAKAAQPGGEAASGSGAAADGTQDQDAAPVSVTIGFTQTLSISLLDLNGHGTTLFKRPDGSTGAMSFEPTHIEA